jgi:hypothetical protein
MDNQLTFTYLLGAGASALAHPTVKDFPVRLRNFNFTRLFPDEDLTHRGTIKEIESEFKWLADHIDSYTSPDTFAKVAFLKHTPDKDSYNRIKNVLTFFFYLAELNRSEPRNDPRYINFLCSIIKNRPAYLPENVKIIAWNYDFQLELAANLIHEDNSFPVTQNQITKRKPPLIEYFPGTSANFSNTHLGIVHLNGSAYLSYDNQKFSSAYHKTPPVNVETAVNFWNSLKKKIIITSDSHGRIGTHIN